MSSHVIKRLTIFGGTGHCGQAVVEEALKYYNSTSLVNVRVMVRDVDRAKTILDSFVVKDDDSKKGLDSIEYIQGDIYKKEDVANAIKDTDAIISCIASYQSPHDQMSSLTANVLEALEEQEQSKTIRYVHYGYPRGYSKFLSGNSSSVEQAIVSLVKLLSFNKYGPAIRDHEKVHALLEASPILKENSSYMMFCAPNMVDSKPVASQGSSYYGKKGTVDTAIRSSRVWDAVSIRDAAEMILAHVMDTDPMPKIVCLSYRER